MITVVFSSNAGAYLDKKFATHIKSTIGLKDAEVICFENFGEASLAKTYNKAISEARHDRIVFVHNDVEFLSKNWGRNIARHLMIYGIVGVAGTHTLSKEKRGCWWEHPLGGLASDALGTVWHQKNGVKYPTVYSESFHIEDAVAVDGVLIGIDRTKIVHPFKEYAKFHFYDIPFCIANHLGGVKIGVMDDVPILHKSVGKLSKEWADSKEAFFYDYPDTYTVKPRKTYEVDILGVGGRNHISVIVPFSESRRDFFESKVIPSLKANSPHEIIVVKGEGTAPEKRNHGFALSSQELIFFCDDDIVIPEGYFDALSTALADNPNSAYAYTGYKGIVHHKDTHPAGGDYEIPTYDFNAEDLKKGNYISTMSLLRREFFLGFDDRLKKFQDWDLWLGILKKFGKGGVAVHGMKFEAHYLDEGITSSKNRSPESVMLLKSKYGIL